MKRYLSLLFLLFMFQVLSHSRVLLESKVVFFSKSHTEGKVEFSGETVMLKNVKDNVIYEIEIKYKDIDYVHPVLWNPEIKDFKNNKIEYYFYPVKYIVKLKNGDILDVVGRVKEFEEIILHAKKGKTKIYSYYVDYLVFKDDEARWQNMNTPEIGKNFLIPHPNVIWFLYLK